MTKESKNRLRRRLYSCVKDLRSDIARETVSQSGDEGSELRRLGAPRAMRLLQASVTARRQDGEALKGVVGAECFP